LWTSLSRQLLALVLTTQKKTQKRRKNTPKAQNKQTGPRQEKHKNLNKTSKPK